MNKATIFVELAALALLSTSALAVTTTSPQNNKEQVHSMWCWNASVRNLIYTESNGKRDLWQCDIGTLYLGSTTPADSTTPSHGKIEPMAETG